MKVYHQMGHNSVWNQDLFNEGIGDGLIISPLHLDVNKVEEISAEIKAKSLFDPQFYIPGSQKTKLNSYDFFPEKIMGGFETKGFSSHAAEVAKKCLDFQLKNEFSGLVIPARYFDDMVTDYIEKQKVFTVEPFLESLTSQPYDKSVYLTLPVTISMLSDTEYRAQLLDWISSYPEISGIYLLVNFNVNTKQIREFDLLKCYVDFIMEAKKAELDLVCGHSNTEGLLLTPLEIEGVTIGTYENTRSFNVDKFLELESDRRGPTVRVYFPRLLNWIRFDTAKEIKEDRPELWKAIYQSTIDGDVLMKKDRPYFTQPDSYKHHLRLIYSQYEDMIKLSSADKVSFLRDAIKNASGYYRKIEETNILFTDDNCRGVHLSNWNRLLNHIEKNYL